MCRSREILVHSFLLCKQMSSSHHRERQGKIETEAERQRKEQRGSHHPKLNPKP